MASWDRQPAQALAKQRDAAVRRQVLDEVGAFSPYWRERLRELGVATGSVRGVADLARIPAVGERDVAPDGDPARLAALVLQPSEAGYVTHGAGPQVRRALARRLVSADAYRQVVEEETRPTSFLYAGLGFRYPLASTRGDLDVIARAGRRAFEVLGIGPADTLISALPPTQVVEHVALQLGALASGVPAFYPGEDPRELAATLRLAPASVLAAPSAAAADVVDDLASAGCELAGLRRLLLLGAPRPADRAAAAEALRAAGAGDAVVLAVHAPAGARVLWAECAPESGWHTYPDLEVVQLVDPETGEAAEDGGPGELVVTQLGLRGSALLRWRTGDVVTGGLAAGPCEHCGRAVPRVPATLRAGALVVRLADLRRPLDLRAAAGALVGRPDVADWRIVLRRRDRDGHDQALVYVRSAAEPTEVAAAVAGDLRAAAGVLPSQLVVDTALELPDVLAEFGRRTGPPTRLG